MLSCFSFCYIDKHLIQAWGYPHLGLVNLMNIVPPAHALTGQIIDLIKAFHQKCGRRFSPQLNSGFVKLAITTDNHRLKGSLQDVKGQGGHARGPCSWKSQEPSSCCHVCDPWADRAALYPHILQLPKILSFNAMALGMQAKTQEVSLVESDNQKKSHILISNWVLIWWGGVVGVTKGSVTVPRIVLVLDPYSV